MERKKRLNILSCFLLFAGIALSSCSKNDLENGDTSTGVRMLSADVSQCFNESPDELTRGLPTKHDTVFQKLDTGLEIEAFIEEDKIEKSRANTIEAVAPGTKVLAFVINASTDIIYRIQQLEVSEEHKLTCEIPTDVRTYVVFYSYNDTRRIPFPKWSEGGSASEVRTGAEDYNVDLLWAKTGPITKKATTLGSIKFSHLYSRVRIRLSCDFNISGFTSTLSEFGGREGLIDALHGTVQEIIGGNDFWVNHTLNSETLASPQPIVQSSYSPFIPCVYATQKGTLDFTINDTDINRSIPNIDARLQGGHSYTICVNISSSKNVKG